MSEISPAFDDTTVIKGWVLTARDLTEQGASAVSISLHGDPSVIVTYSQGKARVTVGNSTVVLEDAELDETGVVPVPDPVNMREAVAAGLIETDTPAFKEKQGPASQGFSTEENA